MSDYRRSAGLESDVRCSICGEFEDECWCWKGPTEEEWVERIARPSTPVGETTPWIKTNA